MRKMHGQTTLKIQDSVLSIFETRDWLQNRRTKQCIQICIRSLYSLQWMWLHRTTVMHGQMGMTICNKKTVAIGRIGTTICSQTKVNNDWPDENDIQQSNEKQWWVDSSELHSAIQWREIISDQIKMTLYSEMKDTDSWPIRNGNLQSNGVLIFS